MHVQAIHTKRVECGDRLHDILQEALPPLQENDIVAITSKIISISQGRVVPHSQSDKQTLIKQEAEAIADVSMTPYGACLTLINGMLMLSAGIDESNGNDTYILYPQAIQETASTLWRFLREVYQLSSLGILITDSHTTPLRRGVTGICLGWCGFEPFYSYIGQPDLYERPLRMTQINLLDALATTAVLVMGEGNEQTPLALIREAPKITFLSHPPTVQEVKHITIPFEEDLYAPLFTHVPWKYSLKSDDENCQHCIDN